MDNELRVVNEFLNVNGMFIDKCTATGKYFWMLCENGTYTDEKTGFDTVQEAFDDAMNCLNTRQNN